MENEYDDFKLISPDKMEQISKKYYNKLEELNHIDSVDLNKNSTNLYSFLCGMEQNIISLKKTCNRRFIYNKLPTLSGIENKISELKLHFSKDTTINEISTHNYCDFITSSIGILLSSALECVGLLNKINNNNLRDIILLELEIVKDLSSLIGSCRYRSIF